MHAVSSIMSGKYQRNMPAANGLVRLFVDGERMMVELQDLSINQLKLICKVYYNATGFKNYKKADWVRRANELIVAGRVAHLRQEDEDSAAEEDHS